MRECVRCQGLMVEQDFFDLEGTHGFMWMKGWRCMNCGYAADPVTEANHRLHQATRLVRSPEEGEHEPEPEQVYRRTETVMVRSISIHRKEFHSGTDSQARL